MQTNFQFNETSPATPSTGTASSVQVIGAPTTAPAGVLTGVQLDGFGGLAIAADLVGATGGTLDVYIQTSPNGGTTWFDYAHFTQLTNGNAAVRYAFAVSPSGLLTPSVVGINLTPALAAGVCIGGAWGDRMRLVFVAGTGTTAGAPVKVYVSGQRPNA